MKTITSYGGPLIGLEEGIAKHWRGVEGKSFLSSKSLLSNDYEEACNFSRSDSSDVNKLSGSYGSALLLKTPVETAIISNSRRKILIAQVEYCDEGWDFSDIDKFWFNFEENDEKTIKIDIQTGKFFLFDAANPFDCIKNGIFSLELEGGKYNFPYRHFLPNDETGLILYKLEQIDPVGESVP